MIDSTKLITIIFTLISLLSTNSAAAGRLPVFASILPQKYFVQQIGRDLVDVQIMVRPGANPATYEPKPRQMAALSQARIYFAIGVPFESAWLQKIAATNPGMKVVHTDYGIEKLVMAVHGHENETGKRHEKEDWEHAGLDPHIWLSPPLVKVQARTILTALQEADPQHAGIFADNFQAFAARIDALDDELKKDFAGRQGLKFMVFHPSWGYFAQAYGLEQVPIEIEGKSPKPAHLKALIENARKDGILVIFVQPQFSTKSAGLVAREIGGQIVFADPLSDDWLENLRRVATKFIEALK